MQIDLTTSQANCYTYKDEKTNDFNGDKYEKSKNL